MDNGKDKLFFRQKLMEMVDDAGQVEAICSLFETTLQCAEEERKVKQLEGIKKAKMEGKRLGRPRLQEPEGFCSIISDWKVKKLSAAEAAALSGMGISTFYRRVRSILDAKGGDGNDK